MLMSFKIPDRPEDIEQHCSVENDATSTTGKFPSAFASTISTRARERPSKPTTYADVVGLLNSCRSLNLTLHSNTFSRIYFFLRNFDSSKQAAQPVAAVLGDHITIAQEVLENEGVSDDDKEDAFGAIKVSTFFLCWLCKAVAVDAGRSGQASGKKPGIASSTKLNNILALWKVTLGALHQVAALDFGIFQRGEHHTPSLLCLCLKQADLASRSCAIKDKGCVASLTRIFIALAQKHDLLEEVKTVLTRVVYDFNDSHVVQFLAREICEKCLRSGFTKLPEAILQDMLENYQPEDYIRLSEMGSRVADFLNCASDSCSRLVRQKFLPCLERHLSHGMPEMRSAIITLMGNIIKLSDEGMEDTSDASKLAMRVTNWSLLRQIMSKHEDENARTRVRVIQCLDMLVEYCKFSDATLGKASSEAMEQLALVLHQRTEDVRPTVRRAAMKLTQTVVVRNPIGHNLNLQLAQDREKSASHQLEVIKTGVEARQMLLNCVSEHDQMGQLTRETDGELDDAGDAIQEQENNPAVANVQYATSEISMQEELDRAMAEVDSAKFAVCLIEALHTCVFHLEALLTSAESSDVVESITTLKLMRSFGIQPATDCIGNALQLVTQATQKPEVVTTVMDMFENLYLSHESPQRIATALVELLNARRGEDMERTMCCCLGKAMSADGSFKNYTAVAHGLLDLVMRLTGLLPSDDAVLHPVLLHLRVLHAIASHKPSVCAGNVPKLLNIAHRFPQPRYAFLQLMVVRLFLLMFDNQGTREEVNCTEVLKVFARHLVGPHTDAASIMLLKESQRGLFKIDKSNPLRLMRLVCQGNSRIAAAALQQQQQIMGASAQTSRVDSTEPAAARAGGHEQSPAPGAGGAVAAADVECGESFDKTGPGKGHAEDALEGDAEEGQLDSPEAHAREDEPAPADMPSTVRRQHSTRIKGDGYQASLAAALVAVGETALLHKHVIDVRMDQAEAIQATDQAASDRAQQNQADTSDSSLAACVQSQKENLELERERLEDHVQRALQPMLAVVITLCRSKALFRTNKTLRATALLALVKMMCAYKSICEETTCLQLLFSCLSPRYREFVDSGLQLTLMAGTADLLNRWANTLDPWTDHFFGFLDDHVHPKKHGIRILTKLILSAMLKPTGKIYRVCHCLNHEDIEVQKAGRNLFKECATKKTDQGGNLVYRMLPDIISNLIGDSTMIDQPEKFSNIMTVLLGHVKEDKHHAALVGTLMDRILQQELHASALLLLNCFELLKGMAACKQMFHSVQQQLPRLRSLLYDENFANKLQRILNKAQSSLKRYGKAEDKDDAVTVIERLEAEINTIRADDHESIVHEATTTGGAIVTELVEQQGAADEKGCISATLRQPGSDVGPDGVDSMELE